MAIQIDPKTGERVGSAPQIDPATGERVGTVAGAGPLGAPQLPAHPTVNMQEAPREPGNLETIPSSQSEPGFTGALKTYVHNFGARVANNGVALLKPFVHPEQTAKEVVARGGFPLTPDAIAATQYNPSGPDAGSTATNILGDVATGFLTHQAARAVPPTVRIIGKVGSAMQGTAADIINSKFSPTMKETIRGNNPGRGILESGIGTTLNKGSLATKISGAEDAVGSRIGDAVTRADQNSLAPPINSSELAPAITGPIDSAVAKLNGPFGTAPTTPFETMRGKLGNTAPGAKASIYGPTAPDQVAPSDLWKHLQNLDQNTRFNTDPEVESVNETRRDIRQGLRPFLEASDPTIKPLSRTYSDLLTAGDAVSRTQGGFGVPKGVSSLIDSTIKSTPVVTGASSGLYKLGGGLKNFATNAPEWMGGKGGSPATVGFQPKSTSPMAPPALLGSGSVAMPGGPDYTGGGFPSRPSIITPQPPSLYGLPAQAGAGEVQPMVGVRNDYPQLASPFARERVPANVFTAPQVPNNGLFTVDSGGQVQPQRLALPAPKPLLKKR